MPQHPEIEIEDTKSAATYSGQNDPSDRDYADSFVWQNVEGWTEGQTYRTPDISTLINTVLGSDGATDAAFGFQITGTGSRAAITYDNNQSLAPELVLIIESDTLL